MSLTRSLGGWLAASSLLASFTLAGCATAPATAPRLEPMPPGTVTTYQRRSTGSYGTGEGPVSWTYGERSWEGRTFPSQTSPQAGTNLIDPGNGGIVVMLNRADQPTMSFDPPWGYQWPLTVGKTWRTRFQITMHPSKRVLPMDVDFRVEAHETVTVPAGTFQTFRVVSTDSQGEVQRYWTAPALGLQTVKRHLERPASHPQGAGTLDGELVSITPPKR